MFNKIKEFILSFISKINNEKVIIYTVMFILYFFMYFSITNPKLIYDKRNNEIYEYINSIRKSNLNLLFLLFINIVLIVLYVLSIINYKKYRYTENKFSDYYELRLIIIIISISSIIIYYDILIFSKELSKIHNNVILIIIFYIISSWFFIIFLMLFFYNINSLYNIEFFISLIVLIIYFLEYIISSLTNLNKLYYQLKNDDFSTLTVNCSNIIKKKLKERFESSSVNSISQQLIDINKQYGDNYLKTFGNIPVSFYNKNIKDYQDLILADFYYPGSYYSYLADSPLNGTPNLEALKISLSTYNSRFIHLDIYSDNDNSYDPNANPVVRCENMKENATPLNLDEVFGLINKWAWINNDPNNLSYPLFLYLNFNFEESNEYIYIKIYKLLVKFFSKYFVDKKYSFSGRNSNFLISMATIKECLGKIIILTNIYPTRTVLDELINSSSNNNNNCFSLNEYKQNYINFDKIGISQDNDKNVLLNNSKTNLSFYYTIPNNNYKNDNQAKAGLFNASFQDCAQYGIQGTLMYIFVPDDNLNKWNLFFEKKNNMNPVLKDESLRHIINKKNIIKKQDPIVSLQEPQKYCLIPGLMSTEKSNLSDTSKNSTC